MMHVLDCAMGLARSGLSISNLYGSPLPRIWSLHWYDLHWQGNVGDYGYVDPRLGRFVCLGNVFDVLERERSLCWSYDTYVNGIAQSLEAVGNLSAEHVSRSVCRVLCSSL